MWTKEEKKFMKKKKFVKKFMIKSNRRRLPAVITPIVSGDTSTQYISSPSRIHSTTITWVKVWKTEKRVHEENKKVHEKKSSWTSSWKECFLLPSHSLPLETHPPNTFISPPRNTAGSLHFPWTLSNLSITPHCHTVLCVHSLSIGGTPHLYPREHPFLLPSHSLPLETPPPNMYLSPPRSAADSLHFPWTLSTSHTPTHCHTVLSLYSHCLLPIESYLCIAPYRGTPRPPTKIGEMKNIVNNKHIVFRDSCCRCDGDAQIRVSGSWECRRSPMGRAVSLLPG